MMLSEVKQELGRYADYDTYRGPFSAAEQLLSWIETTFAGRVSYSKAQWSDYNFGFEICVDNAPAKWVRLWVRPYSYCFDFYSKKVEIKTDYLRTAQRMLAAMLSEEK